MKNILLIILVLFISAAGIVFAIQNKQTSNKGDANMGKKVLVAYFSRTCEQYSVGNITEGNTAIIAKMIADKTNGDLFEIKVKNDNYPNGYDALVEYAKKEKQAQARPEIIGKADNFEAYDTIFISYPNWWADLPMPVYTFLESYDFKGKNIAPFCTHEGSGFTGTQGLSKTGANILKGFALYGHTAQNDRTQADKQVSQWLESIGF